MANRPRWTGRIPKSLEILGIPHFKLASGGSSIDVLSVEGFQNLKNLKTVDYISMCHPEVLKPFKQAGIEIED